MTGKHNGFDVKRG